MINAHFDMSQLINLGKLKEDVEKAAQDALRDLSTMAHAHIVELAQSKLHSTREKYINGLSMTQLSEDAWLINLSGKVMWIEEGMESHSMVEGMLASPKAKTAADGSRYMVVPFEHKKGPTSQTSAGKSLTDTIKSEMKKRGISYGKIENGEDGKPKLGVLHRFSINDKPTKTHNGPGQGHGPIGQVKQGSTGIPYLRGVQVSQSEVKTLGGKNRVVKSITTFRVVSSKHKGTEKWVHPGLKPRKFFEETQEWIEEQWNSVIKPQLIEALSKND